MSGRRVGWHTYGDPSARPLLFVHGWGMMLPGYRSALDALARFGWAVHACDLPGFGRSEPLPLRRSSLAGYAEFVAEAHHRRAVPAHLVLADHDSIVPAGRLRSAPSASTRMVAGNHGWMLRNPDDFATTADRLLSAA